METTRSFVESMKAQAMAGRHMNRIPLGYRRSFEDRSIRIVPDTTAPLLAEAIESVANARSLRAALAMATAKGLRGRDGKPLHLSTFHRVVTNPFYAGFVRFQGKTYPGKHQAIVDAATFRKAQVRLGHARK